MLRRLTTVLSLVLALAVALPAQAESKRVERKKSAPAPKKIERVKAAERVPAPVAPSYVKRPDSGKRPDYRRRPDAPQPVREYNKPPEPSRPAPYAYERAPYERKQSAPPPVQKRYGKGERKAPSREMKGNRPQSRREPYAPPPPERRMERRGNNEKRWQGKDAPDPYEAIRAGERPKVHTRPMPTFLKGRTTDELKQPLPKQKLQGIVESIEGEKAIVRTEDGKRATVVIGPQSYWRKKGYELEKGQEVSVDGWGEWGGGYEGGDARTEGFFFAGGIYGPGYHFELAGYDGYPYWANRDHYWDGWYPSWDVYYVYFWGPPPWWAYSPPPFWYYWGPPPRWWYHRHVHYPPPYWYHSCRW